MYRATFSQDTGDENATQGGDVSEVSVTTCGGVKVPLQWLGVHSASVIWYINGTKACICGHRKTNTDLEVHSQAGFESR